MGAGISLRCGNLMNDNRRERKEGRPKGASIYDVHRILKVFTSSPSLSANPILFVYIFGVLLTPSSLCADVIFESPRIIDGVSPPRIKIMQPPPPFVISLKN